MHNSLPQAITFDDVLLLPAYSEVLPNETILSTQIGKYTNLNIPIISSAMDTVTEAEMAIAMAREGGLGIIHKNMSIENQELQVIRVKRTENGVIKNPVVLTGVSTVQEAKAVMEKFNISGIIVVNSEHKLEGVLTNRDLRYVSDDTNQLVRDIMTSEDLITAQENITIEEAGRKLATHKVEKLPILNKDGVVCGLITMKDIHSVLQYPQALKDCEGRLKVGAAIGNTSDVMERASTLVDAGVDVLTIDSAHGHSKAIIDLVAKIRSKFPSIDIIAGNVVTKEATEALADAGASAVKVGIGPGSICTTRVIAGVGMPQLSAILSVAPVCRAKGIGLIADGGIKSSGDIAKAIAAGADAVMLGSLLAGTEESPGEEVLYEGRKFKSYIGMGSLTAMQRGSGDRYFQEGGKAGVPAPKKKLVPEGIESMVPYRGAVQEVLFQLCGGLRASMGYCGAKDIPTLQKNCKFVQISNASLKENHPHSVILTKEAPNYSFQKS